MEKVENSHSSGNGYNITVIVINKLVNNNDRMLKYQYNSKNGIK